MKTSNGVASALRTIAVAQAGLAALDAALAGRDGTDFAAQFTRAVELLANKSGRAIVSGMGKSGLIARKMTATLASTGCAAHFVHAAEASHGDLGMIQSGDVVLALSWSGETPEFAAIIDYAKRFGIPLIAITSARDSGLGREADVPLILPAVSEACPNGLAPTTSTTLQTVVGDAIAVALLEGRGFSAEDFRILHPGGKLGARLKRVRDVMHVGDRIPRIRVGARMAEAVMEMTSKGFGAVGVLDAKDRLVGIITDGDLRRHLKTNLLLDAPVEEVMTRNPGTIEPNALVAEALAVITHKIATLLVVEVGEVVGIVNFRDLLLVGAA